MAFFPRGVIVQWPFAIGTIPAGYVLCDGTNGTPDMRDRFVVGAGSTYAVGDSGGSVNHNHPFTGDGHEHVLPAGFNLLGGPVASKLTTTDPATGTTNNTNHLPPYYALVFMMKT